MRDIEDILNFRQDLTPFLAHLTRRGSVEVKGKSVEKSAKEVLKTIIKDRRLVAGKGPISDARWGIGLGNLDAEEYRQYFSAISFTETPVGEIHCLLEIRYRSVNLEPYGLVFLKDRLASRGVAPVLYLNNLLGDQDVVVRGLCSLIETKPKAARKLLPLISFFGQKLSPVGGTSSPGNVDFRWEREWRYPHSAGPFSFDEEDIFIGLCPHNHIDEFEALFRDVDVRFIDPRRNMKWYAQSLIASRQRLELKSSVV